MHKIKNICMVMLVSFLLSAGMAMGTDPDGKGLPTWMEGVDKDAYNYHGHGDSKRNGTLDILDVVISDASCDRNSQIGMGESHSRLADERPDMEYVLVNIPLPHCVGRGVESCPNGRCGVMPFIEIDGVCQDDDWGVDKPDAAESDIVDGDKIVGINYGPPVPPASVDKTVVPHMSNCSICGDEKCGWGYGHWCKPYKPDGIGKK